MPKALSTMAASPRWRLALLPLPTILIYLSKLGDSVQAGRINRRAPTGCCGSLRRAERGTAFPLLRGEGPCPGGTGRGSGPAPLPHASGADRGHLPAAEPPVTPLSPQRRRLGPHGAGRALHPGERGGGAALRGSAPPWEGRRLFPRPLRGRRPPREGREKELGRASNAELAGAWLGFLCFLRH